MSWRFLVANATCLAALPAHREWLDEQGIEIVPLPFGTGVEEAVRFWRRSLPTVEAVVGPGPGAISLGSAQLNAANRLKVISLASSGFEWVDLVSATKNGIIVTHAPLESLAEVVADLTWGLLLSVARRIPQHVRQIQGGCADRAMGTMVWRRTLGVVGLGNVGRAVARRAQGFEMRILAAETRPDREFCRKHSVQVVALDQLLREADFVSLHLRLDERTSGMIGQHQLAQMKPTAFLINTARWGLIDEEALARAVIDRTIAGVAADDPPSGAAQALLGLPNAVFTPHIGNQVQASVDMVCRQAYLNALAVVSGGLPNARFILNPEVDACQR